MPQVSSDKGRPEARGSPTARHSACPHVSERLAGTHACDCPKPCDEDTTAPVFPEEHSERLSGVTKLEQR